MRWMVRVILSVGAFLLAGGGVAAPAIPLVTVEARGVARSVPAEGVVEAVRQATVAAQVAGRILEVRADAGMKVAKGQVLLRIDARESVEAVSAARAAASAARSQFERTEKLVAQGFLSPSALDKPRADLEVANAQVVAAQAAGSHALITAPMAGEVAARHAELGEMAQPGRALMTIYQPGALRLVVQVSQGRLPEVRAARQLRVELTGLVQSIELKSFQILPVVDAATHTAEVRIDLPASVKGLLPGMTGRVLFQGAAALRLSVPTAALVHRGEMAAVYVATEQGGQLTYRLRQLRLGERQANGEVEVLAGLQAGERVALDPVRAGIAAVGTKNAPAAAR